MGGALEGSSVRRWREIGDMEGVRKEGMSGHEGIKMGGDEGRREMA